MATSAFEMAKKYYDRGRWSDGRLRALVAKGKLTTAEYTTITGKSY